MTFQLPSPFALASAPLEADVALTEAGLADALERAAELLARMRPDAAAARGVAADASRCLEASAAQVTEAQRALEAAAVPVAKARGDAQRAGRAGDQEAHHWGRQRLQTETHALRRAEDQLRDCMAALLEVEREGATAKRRADFLAAAIERAEQAVVRLAATVGVPVEPAA